MNPTTEHHLFIIFGGTGDLARHKLIPAFYHLIREHNLAPHCRVLAVARRKWTDEEYRAWTRDALRAAGYPEEEVVRWCSACMFYHSLGEGTEADFRRLADRIQDIEAEFDLPGNRVFYLALPPQAFPNVINRLGATGLNRSRGWTRVVVEKPLGHDLASARDLNRLISRYFSEKQIFRIDHYLGKETVQNLLVFRFANPIFESLWSRERIETVQITVAEDVGVESRAGYYDRAGAVRDMLQNHLMQLLTLIAMEVPYASHADAIRPEKIKVLQSLLPVLDEDVVFGQYTRGQIAGKTVPGYREEPGVAPDSRTETFVALRLMIDSWRWHGVPFYLRTGKRMARRLTQIAVVFRQPPVCLFKTFGQCQVHGNVLLITIQPDEGFALYFDVKRPGEPLELETLPLHFLYKEAFGPLPDAYETLILDIIMGDQTLFVHADEVEASWRWIEPILARERAVHPYPAGTWGPPEADALLHRYGHTWRIATEWPKLTPAPDEA